MVRWMVLRAVCRNGEFVNLSASSACQEKTSCSASLEHRKGTRDTSGPLRPPDIRPCFRPCRTAPVRYCTACRASFVRFAESMFMPYPACVVQGSHCKVASLSPGGPPSCSASQHLAATSLPGETPSHLAYLQHVQAPLLTGMPWSKEPMKASGFSFSLEDGRDLLTIFSPRRKATSSGGPQPS